MGRQKFSKKRRSELNKKSVTKRWETCKASGELDKVKTTELSSGHINSDNTMQIDYDNVQPGPSNQETLSGSNRPSLSLFSPSRPTTDSHTDSDSNNDDDTPSHKRPTGFELVSSYKPEVDVCVENAPTYCLVDLSALTTFLEGLPCKFCLAVNTKVLTTKENGFAKEICVHCLSCDLKSSFLTSRKIKDDTVKTKPPYDINRRVIKTFLSLGKGHMGLQTFCIGLNMPCISHSSYDKQINIIVDAAKQYSKSTLQNARVEVEKVYSQIQNTVEVQKPLDITVSYDGSWQKRGFTSKYGVGCVIEVITGLVIDFEVISKYCRVCQTKLSELGDNSEEYEEWLLDHWISCQADFDGSSPAMETEAAERLWKRSMDIGFRYTTVVSDGDSKTYDHLTSLDIYEGVVIEKQECVNHIAKRLGTGLRNLVKDCGKKKITLGGKAPGSLKGTTIDKLSQYYRNAVTSNLEDPQKMKSAIFATLDHCRSTDNKPLHENCPTGDKSWCFYQRDISNNVPPRKHNSCVKTPINETVYQHILPLYKRLSNDELLKRCSSGKTQNANESLHGVIWSKCPKIIFTAKRKVEALVAEGVCLYNEGHLLTMINLFAKTGLSPGMNTVYIARKKDVHRLKLRKQRDSEKYKKYRKLFKSAQMKEEEKKKEQEGLSYGAGDF